MKHYDIDPSHIECMARAIQNAYLHTGHPCDFSDAEIQHDFETRRDMYLRMALAAHRAYPAST